MVIQGNLKVYLKSKKKNTNLFNFIAQIVKFEVEIVFELLKTDKNEKLGPFLLKCLLMALMDRQSASFSPL